MANQITDNRALVDSANAVGNWVVAVAGGGSSLTLDTDVKIEGTGSLAEQISSARRGALYNYTTTQDLTGEVFYLWINCGIVGLLDIKANGGFTVRFAGPTITNYFEVYVGGSDSWPVSVEGGWTQFVVDVGLARSTAITNGWTGGTAPALTAVQHVGYTAVTAGTMTKTADNTWIDELRSLSVDTPGIIVEGRNGGSTDWDSDDIVTQLTTAAGTFLDGAGGSYVLNTPIQFGINDTSTHGFADTNKEWLWADQEFILDGFYKLSALGNSGGTTNVNIGLKTGTGDAATGAQGLTITAAPAGALWDMDFNDANLDAINFYGCNLKHGGDFLLDDAAVECITVNYIDCLYALVSNSLQLRINSIAPATLDGVAFMQTDQLDDIRYSTFQFGDGHAIELVTPLDATQASVENTFDAGFGADGTNDAALYNNQAGAVVISRTGGTAPTVRNGTSASTTINATVLFSLTNVVSSTSFNLDGIFALATAGATWNNTGDSIIRMTASIPSSFAASGDVRLWNGTYYETYAYTGKSGTDLTGVTPTLSQDFSAAKALLVMIAPKLITLDPHTENIEANQQFEAMLAKATGGTVYKPEFFEDNAGSGFARRVAQIEDA